MASATPAQTASQNKTMISSTTLRAAAARLAATLDKAFASSADGARGF
jgi:hypothetical protein